MAHVRKKARAKPPARAATKPPAKAPARAKARPKTRLLAGDNPQIPLGFGDAPVKAYIAAVPGWKRDVVKRLDALVGRAVPGVKKAVKWNSPLYGVEQGRWFLAYHCFTSYVKVTFFRGTSLEPVPAGTSKNAQIRYYDVREGELDDAQFTAWVKQASKLPGMKM